MPDTSETRATLPFPSGTDAAAEAAPQDPLAGDWAEGLRGPVCEVALKRPTRLRGESGPTPRPLSALPPEQRTEQADLRMLRVMSDAMGGAPGTALQSPPPAEDEVEAPDAWASTDDQLASVPPPPREQAAVTPPAAEAPLAAGSAAELTAPPDAEAPGAPGHDTDETLHPLTAVQLAAPASAASTEPAAEEVMLLSDAELAEDEPLASPAPAAAQEAAAPEAAAPLAEAALAAPEAGPLATAGEEVPEAEGAAASAHPAEGPPAATAEPEPHAPEGRVTPLALAAAPEVHLLALPAASAPLALGPGDEAQAAAEAPALPLAAATPAMEPPDAGEQAAALDPHPLADATVHEGAPIALHAAGAVAQPGSPLAEDLENTVLSLALESMQRAPGPSAAAPEAAPAEEVVEQLPEDAIAEPLPEDAIAGAVDPEAPWNHAEIMVAPHGAAAAQTPWDTAAAPEWHADPASGGWAGSAAQPAAPGATSAAPAGSWGTPAAPAAHSGGWGDAPAAAAAAHDTWGSPAAPAGAHRAQWGALAPAEAAVVSSWAVEPAGAFSADKLVSSPGAADWVIEAAPGPAAAAWEAAAPATPGGWAVQLAGGATPAGSPFAPLAPGASLSAEEPVFTDHAAELSPDDADLPVPIYEPEPVLPSSHLAVAGEHRVAIHTRAGRTRRGVVKDVDLAGTGFSLQPQSGTGVPESVQAAEVKAIFFMLPPGEKHAPGSGAKVRVTFEDGRTIEGQRDGDDAPEGFFLVPGDAARTNTRRIFVARAAVQDLREG